MSVEVRPLGVKCNLQCVYCYQCWERDAGNILNCYDIDKMKNSIEKQGVHFTLFGGEALMVPERDLEELWRYGYDNYGTNGIQTNGTLITEEHIEMFKKYNVNVGISVDGPGELNDARWNGSLEKTREATSKTLAAIERLAHEGITLSIIVTLHRLNATRDKLPLMHNWLRRLDKLGVSGIRLHLLEVENEDVERLLSLTTEENVEAILSFHELGNELNTLKNDVSRDMINMLLGQDKNATCCWTGCDPYTTSAVQGIEGNGQSSNCTRINKEGVDFIKSEIPGYERYIGLYYTPEENYGCQGCRFFIMCRGQCPGCAVNLDWRNRTSYCAVWKNLFSHIEKEIVDRGQIPLSQSPHRDVIEKCLVNGWSNGLRLSVADILADISRHKECPSFIENLPEEYVKNRMNKKKKTYENRPHGDVPHGDHTDKSRVKSNIIHA